jgi:RNA polymerase sigma-70 factor (ECF subfamily)
VALNHAQLEDAALMHQLQGGDEHAYRELVARHLKRCVNFAYRLLTDAQEAEDVAQEVFLKLWRNASSWEPRQELKHWLITITKNLCIDRLRQRKPEGVDAELIADSARPVDMLERKRTSERVQNALQSLPDRQRVALTLAHFEGATQQEVANIMNLSAAATESLLSRARRTLRSQLAEFQASDSKLRAKPEAS